MLSGFRLFHSYLGWYKVSAMPVTDIYRAEPLAVVCAESAEIDVCSLIDLKLYARNELPCDGSNCRPLRKSVEF